MIIAQCEGLIFSFTGIEKEPHFNRIGYKVIGKRMISTLPKDHLFKPYICIESGIALHTILSPA